MAELIDLATTAAGNTARFPENMQFRAVNDAARELEAMIAREKRDTNMSLAASGSSNAFAITTNQTITSYYDNLVLGFTANHSITGAATLNVNGLGAKSITAQDGSSLGRNDIVSGQKVLVVYKTSSGGFQIVGGRVAGSSADVLARIVKAGTVMAWPAATAPAGWLECNGAAISRTTYAELFAAIGTTYGAGDGSTTFNLPDYRGEFLRGFANGSSNDPDRATRTNRGDGTTGDAVGTKQSGETEAHTHAASLTVAATGSTSMAPDHVHSYGIPATSVFYGAGGSGTVWSSTTTPTTSGPAGAHTHTVSVTGTAAGTTNPSIGDETRPRNIAVMWIILANPAAASAAALGLAGFAYSFDTGTTDADPGTGKLRWNNATTSSATGIYISETDGYGAPLGEAIKSLPANTGLYIFKVGEPSTFAYFTMGAAPTDGGSYDKILSLTYVAGNGTFAAGDPLTVVPFRAGATGPTGADGGLRWTYDSSTSIADPGTGAFRLNSLTLSAANELAISASTAETGNPDFSDWVAGWDDSTTTSDRGQIILRNASGTAQAVYSVNGAITDNSTWLAIPVQHIASSGTLSSTVLVSFARTGNAGAGAGDVTATNFGTDNRVVRSDGTLKAVQASAVTIDDSGNVSGVGTLTSSGVMTAGTTAATAVKLDPSGFIEVPEISAPSSPASGFLRLYAKSDGKAYQKNDAGTETDLSAAASGTAPTVTVYTSGSGTWSRPSNCTWIRVRMIGGGGGGAGSGTSAGWGGAGGNTTFSTLTASGGSGPSSSIVGGAGGSASGATINIAGGRGSDGSNSSSVVSGFGGSTILGPGAGSAVYGGSAGRSASANTGGGGSGATASTGTVAAAGGGGGGYCESIIASPSASYSYAVGAGGSAGSAGGSGSAGGAGGSGLIIVEEFYS